MPIIVRHEPDPQFLADTGYQIGQGQAIQEQQEMQLRERMQQRAIYANMLSQRLAQQDAIGRQVNSIGAQFERQQQGFQQQDQLLQQRHEQAMELQRIKEENEREMSMQKQQWEQENILLGGMRDEDRSMGLHFQNLTRSAFNKLDELAMNGYQFSDDQQKEIKDTMQEIDKVHRNILEGRMTNLQGLEATARMAQRLVLITPQLAPTQQEQMQKAVGTVNTGEGTITLIDKNSQFDALPRTAQPEKPSVFAATRSQDGTSYSTPDGRVFTPEQLAQAKYDEAMADPKMRIHEEQLAMQALSKGAVAEIPPEAIDAWIKKKFGIKDDKKTAAQAPPAAAGTDVELEVPDGA